MTCRLWNGEGECKLILSKHKGYINCVAFAPHGGRLATGRSAHAVPFALFPLRQSEIGVCTVA